MRTLTDEPSTVPLLRAQQLELSSPSLRIDLSVKCGDRIAFTGDVDGITALLRTLIRFDEPEDGQLWWGSHDVTFLKPRRLHRFTGRMGYIPANPYTLFEYQSSVERLFSRAEQQRYSLDELARAVGLTPVVAQHQIKALSGATLVRVALMRMVLMQPDILMVDDVFSHLAPEVGGRLLKTILDILKPEQALLVNVQQTKLVAQLDSWISLVDGQLKYP